MTREKKREQRSSQKPYLWQGDMGYTGDPGRGHFSGGKACMGKEELESADLSSGLRSWCPSLWVAE